MTNGKEWQKTNKWEEKEENGKGCIRNRKEREGINRQIEKNGRKGRNEKRMELEKKKRDKQEEIERKGRIKGIKKNWKTNRKEWKRMEKLKQRERIKRIEKETNRKRKRERGN